MADPFNFRIGVLTLSDKGSVGARIDTSGPAIAEMVGVLGCVEKVALLPDDADAIAALLCDWTATGLDLILTTGGTGLAPRDVTPEATLQVIDRQVPGMAEAMRQAGLQKTPHAMLSRGVVGVRGRTLIVNLPGSEKAVRENLAVILQTLPHALSTLRGVGGDCGRL